MNHQQPTSSTKRHGKLRRTSLISLNFKQKHSVTLSKLKYTSFKAPKITYRLYNEQSNKYNYPHLQSNRTNTKPKSLQIESQFIALKWLFMFMWKFHSGSIGLKMIQLIIGAEKHMLHLYLAIYLLWCIVSAEYDFLTSSLYKHDRMEWWNIYFGRRD